MDEFRFKSLGELYKKLLPALNTKVGDLIIDPSNGLIPVASVIGFDRINMSKRKILKKYNEVMEVEKDEESI